MRVLVTGATGFIGTAVLRALHRCGHDTVGLVRDPARAEDLEEFGVDLRKGDMLDPATYVPIVATVDAVVHAAQLAVPVRLTPKRSQKLFEADAVMTEALADACVANDRRLLYTGGCFDWGDHGDSWIDETTPLTPSPMGVGHARQATLLDERHRSQGLDVVRLSPGFVYGPGGLFAEAFVDQARNGRLKCIGAGRNWWSCIHVDDLADAYVTALVEAPAGSNYAVVDDEPVRLRELTDLTTDAMNLKRVGVAPPALIALILGKTLTRSLTTSFRIDGSKLKRETSWTPKHARFRDHVEAVVASMSTAPA